MMQYHVVMGIHRPHIVRLLGSQTSRPYIADAIRRRGGGRPPFGESRAFTARGEEGVGLKAEVARVAPSQNKASS